MAETRCIGRILPYETALYEEKISKFVLRVNEQIQVLKLGIVNGNVNNVQTAKNFARKAEKFLETPFFLIEENKDKRVKNLKAETKVNVGVRKELITIIENWLQLKNSQKVVTAKKYSPYKDHKAIDFISEIQIMYNQDVDFLNGLITKYTSDSILLNRLNGILSDKSFLQSLGCKNSWMVSTLKKELSDWGEGESLRAEEELQEVLSLPFFTRKKYLTMDVASLKEVVKIKAEIVNRILEWLNDKKCRREAGLKKVMDNKNEFMNHDLYDLLNEYEEFIKRIISAGKTIKEEYTLYRFGQGMIEADIFASLYK